jgi:hypothetical protein
MHGAPNQMCYTNQDLKDATRLRRYVLTGPTLKEGGLAWNISSHAVLPVPRRHPCGGRDPEHGYSEARPIHDGNSLSNRKRIGVSLWKEIPVMKPVCRWIEYQI